jgi:protein-L-isoaspartate(D-aspartate) O-methyltransferase
LNQQTWDTLIQKLIKNGVLRSQKVIRAMKLVPREHFLPDNTKTSAALDCPLSIGWGQTASAPLG